MGNPDHDHPASLQGCAKCLTRPFFAKGSTAAKYSYIGTVGDFDYEYFTWYLTSNKKTTLGFAWETVEDSEGHIIVYCFL